MSREGGLLSRAGLYNMQETISFINSVGFPIVAFLLMFWLNVKVITKNTEAISNLTNYLKGNSNEILSKKVSTCGDVCSPGGAQPQV